MSNKRDNIYIYLWEEFNTIYVGRTKNPKSRHYQHRHIETESTYKFSSEHGVEHPKMIIVENDLTIEEGVEREKYWINYYKENSQYNVLNKTRGGQTGRTPKYSEEERKERERLSAKVYYTNNKEKILDKKKEYRETHKEEIAAKKREWYESTHPKSFKKSKEEIKIAEKEYKKRYREIHKEEIAAKKREWYEKNKEIIKNKYKKYRNNHKDELKEYMKKYVDEHRDSIRESNKKSCRNYYQKNKEKFKKYYEKKKLGVD